MQDWPKGDAEFRFYDGEWRADEPHGRGVLQYSDGRVYEGDFKNWNEGEFQGCGTMWYPDGDVYVGQWKNGEHHGRGALHISPEANRRQEWTGDYFGVEMSRFKDGDPVDEGIRWCSDGTTQKLHFDAANCEKRLVREITRAEAVKLAAKLGMTPPDASVAPPFSEAAKASIAAAEERGRQQRPAAGSSITISLKPELAPLDVSA